MKPIKYIAAILLLIFIHLYFYSSEYLKRVDYKFYDTTSMIFNQAKEQRSASYSVVVDIDEKSLQQLGQWPLPRVIDAQLIDRVYSMNPSAIAVNILFLERDRVSPIAIQDFYKNFFDLEIQLDEFPSLFHDNDKLLAKSIEESGATLSTYFHNSGHTADHCNELSYKNNMFSSKKTEFNAPILLCNYKTIQGSVENFGFINAKEDSDGIFRRVPLFIEYKKHIFPSLALATLLSFDKDIKIDRGIDTILIDSFKKNPKVFSAIDILNGNVLADEIQGKIVIIGSSVIGLDSTFVTSNRKSISNNMIHAIVADTILSDAILTQPEVYKKINILFSFLFSIIMMILFIKRLYLYIGALFLVTISMTVLSLYYFYLNGLYISIGYFWTPLTYVFILLVIYYSIKLNRDKQEQEKILIIQSKLASMGEMITLIAHQWRQPLSAINGVVINIDVDNRKKILDDKKLDIYLNQIEETTAYLSKTINDFTDFFSKNKKSEVFYLRDIVKQTENLTVISSHKNIEISYSEKENIQVVGYSSELIQSLLILLNNAIFACQKNLKNINQGEITIDAYREKSNVFIRVRDNGGGIEEKNIRKIFDPYFTTKNKESGTGLGLYILRLIVEDSMNGKIFVHNGKEGAVFTLQIPLKK